MVGWFRRSLRQVRNSQWVMLIETHTEVRVQLLRRYKERHGSAGGFFKKCNPQHVAHRLVEHVRAGDRIGEL